jgi:hypothetical protein
MAFTSGLFLAPEFSIIRLQRLPSLYVAAGTLGFFFLGVRFPRAGGIPALLIVGLVAISGALVMRPFLPVRGSANLARITLISTGTSSYVEVEATPAAKEGERYVVELPAPRIAVRATVLRISPYLFFLGAETGVLLTGIDSVPDVEAESSGGGPAEPGVSDSGAAEDPYGPLPLPGSLVELIPLLSLETAESSPVTLELLRPYHAEAGADGSLSVVIAPSVDEALFFRSRALSLAAP